MIDFEKQKEFNMEQNEEYADKVEELLTSDEDIVDAFKSGRDGAVFTNKRIILVNVQGITGKKIDYTFIPYKKINVFSVQTAGFLDSDVEMELDIINIGKLVFEFTGKCNIKQISTYIAEHID